MVENGGSNGGVDAAPHPVRTLSLVTVVFEAEYPLLELQARSMAAFLSRETVREIVVIDNSWKPMSDRTRRRILRAYGPHTDRVRFVGHREIAAVPPSIGWMRQQILKLEVARLVSSDAYVVLDAKNHLVAHADFSTFVAASGRPLGNFHPYETHPLRTSLERVLGYVALPTNAYIRRFTATTTPFVILTNVATELVEAIAAREGRSFGEVFVSQSFTEFFLYSAWLESSGRPVDEVYDDRGIANVTVWPRGRDRRRVDAAIDDVDRRSARFLSIHRTALARMDSAALASLSGFWVRRGMFANRAEVTRFVWLYRARYVRAMVAKKLRERLSARR
ncbi:DUF6492 family protein [Marisediminicola sp. LYQ85]|uniref:DUF6492 family protein n=1 Tax=Marisediminicola sp. LYQ85 TaxID=3391062 RepID=UPI003983268A